MLAGWDGQLTVTLREQLHRHIGRCATCSTRRDLELHPARLLGQSPGEALAAAAADSLRAAAGAPAALRARTLAAGGRAGTGSDCAPGCCARSGRDIRLPRLPQAGARAEGGTSARGRVRPSPPEGAGRRGGGPGGRRRHRHGRRRADRQLRAREAGRRTSGRFRAADRGLGRSAIRGLAGDLADKFGDAVTAATAKTTPPTPPRPRRRARPLRPIARRHRPLPRPRRPIRPRPPRHPQRRRPSRRPREPFPSPRRAARCGYRRAAPRSR